MHILSIQQQAQPDIVALAMVIVLIGIVAAMALRKRKQRKNTVLLPAEPKKLPNAPGSAGELKLYNVEPKTAAMLMAIVAYQIGKPLNELRFLSIREVE